MRKRRLVPGKLQPQREQHGAAGSRLYIAWCNMRARCADHPDYQGRGVRVCSEWRESFGAFRSWALSNGYADHLTLDRRDNDGHYEPGNCRWVTNRDQQRNKRTNRLVSFQGSTRPLAEWCEALGLRYDTVHNRLELGWPPERAFA